jgi:hypothetical protein
VGIERFSDWGVNKAVEGCGVEIVRDQEATTCGHGGVDARQTRDMKGEVGPLGTRKAV